jgi:hypothetical protein
MFIALVAFLGPDKGGRSTCPDSGYRPQIDAGGEFTSCAIESLVGETVFAFDTPSESHCTCCSRTCIKVDSLLAVPLGSTREATWWAPELSLRSASVLQSATQ